MKKRLNRSERLPAVEGFLGREPKSAGDRQLGQEGVFIVRPTRQSCWDLQPFLLLRSRPTDGCRPLDQTVSTTSTKASLNAGCPPGDHDEGVSILATASVSAGTLHHLPGSDTTPGCIASVTLNQTVRAPCSFRTRTCWPSDSPRSAASDGFMSNVGRLSAFRCRGILAKLEFRK